MAIPSLFKTAVVRILDRWGLWKPVYRSRALKSQFKYFGEGSKLYEPIAWVLNPQFISIGDHVKIHPYVRLVACGDYPESGQKFSPILTIGNGTDIGWFVSIQTNNRVEIGKDVIIGSKTAITDLQHTFYDPNRPIIKQPLSEGGYVVIEDGCYLGHGVIVLPNVTIGKNSVVGAGSVVTKNVPPFTVVAGNPAKVIRKFDSNEMKWVRAKEKNETVLF